MSFAIFVQLSCLVILLGITTPVLSVKVDITKFGNCEIPPGENMDQFVYFTDILLEKNADGLCDTVHGTFVVPTVLTTEKLMNITMYRCKADTTGPCAENAEHFYEVLPCERFHTDETGPWYMFSQGMHIDHKCGQTTGSLALQNAQLKPEYLTNFMVHDTEYPRHRMIHMIRKEVEGTFDMVIRACIDMEFTVIFD